MQNNTRTRMIAGNWKMNKNTTEATQLAQDLSLTLKEADVQGVDVVVCPPMVDLRSVQTVMDFENSPFSLGAQNCYWEPSGAYTGETSCDMLSSLGCDYCIIGHSERRGYFHETDSDINNKAKALVAAGIKPIICCGESLEVREAGTHVDFVVAQIKAALEGLDIKCGCQIVIAYEPIWAIGTGMTATADDAQEVCGAIRETLVEVYGEELASKIRVLYGGSAKPGNVLSFLEKEDVDGTLVGGASLKADSFSEMVVKAAQ